MIGLVRRCAVQAECLTQRRSSAQQPGRPYVMPAGSGQCRHSLHTSFNDEWVQEIPDEGETLGKKRARLIVVASTQRHNTQVAKRVCDTAFVSDFSAQGESLFI